MCCTDTFKKFSLVAAYPVGEQGCSRWRCWARPLVRASRDLTESQRAHLQERDARAKGMLTLTVRQLWNFLTPSADF